MEEFRRKNMRFVTDSREVSLFTGGGGGGGSLKLEDQVLFLDQKGDQKIFSN